MENGALLDIPRSALLRLEVFAGEYDGLQTLYPPGGQVVSFDAFCSVTREACDRFVKVEFYAEVPGLGIESSTAIATYSSSKRCYQMWLFSSLSEEPLYMTGNFNGSQLTMISEPWSMPWGLQRLRGTFTPRPDGSFDFLSELWELDGYVMFRSTHFKPRKRVPS